MPDALDLYRVGVPSIGEMWPNRFNYSRSTGGLGTGVYAFRDRSAAKRNISRASPESELYVLHDALPSPVEPQTREATEALVKLSRMMDLLRVQNDIGQFTYEDALDALPGAVKVRLTRSITGGDRGWGEGGVFISSVAREVLFNTPELRERYGYDEDEFVRDFVQATREAEQRLGPDGEGVQPINVLLYPDYDGVAPADGAGGNTAKHGCVIFKQRIDECVGHETESFEEIPAATLNACWGDA